MKRVLEKVLSANDTGETGGHQAGMLIPKDESLAFFPKLAEGVKNPRATVDLKDEAGRDWSFQFIYYNNKFHGGTRNEYRLTGMTEFIRDYSLRAGDRIILERVSPRLLLVRYRRAHSPITSAGKLRLGGQGWKVVDFEDED